MESRGQKITLAHLLLIRPFFKMSMTVDKNRTRNLTVQEELTRCAALRHDWMMTSFSSSSSLRLRLTL